MALVGFLAGACGDDGGASSEATTTTTTTEAAAEDGVDAAVQAICDEFNAPGLTVAQAGALAAELIRTAPSAVGLVEEACGNIATLALGTIGEGAFADAIDLKLDGCQREGDISGTLTNGNSFTADVTLRYELTNDAGARVGDGFVFVDRVDPGQKVLWDEFLFDDFARCTIAVDRVAPS